MFFLILEEQKWGVSSQGLAQLNQRQRSSRLFWLVDHPDVETTVQTRQDDKCLCSALGGADVADKRQTLHLSHAHTMGQPDSSNGLGPPFFGIAPNPAPETLRFYHFSGAKQEGRVSFLHSKACKECPLGNGNDAGCSGETKRENVTPRKQQQATHFESSSGQ